MKIVAFLCKWCSYSGADKAGMQQLSVPSDLSVVRVNCSGRVEPTLILEAFQKGADGVMVLACHPGDCHYKEGNLRASCRAELLSPLLQQLGVNQERFCFDYISAVEAEKFSRVTSEFLERLQNLSKKSRKGWSDSFAAMHAAGDDELLFDDALDMEEWE